VIKASRKMSNIDLANEDNEILLFIYNSFNNNEIFIKIKCIKAVSFENAKSKITNELLKKFFFKI